MNQSWGYDISDKKYKSSDEIIHYLVKAAGKNANLLLNIGPRPDGELPAEALERLKAIGTFMQTYGKTIYGTRGGIVGPHDWGVSTQRGNTLYVHILNWNDKGLYLPIQYNKVKHAVMFTSRKPVEVSKAGEGVAISLPEVPRGVDTVVEITLK